MIYLAYSAVWISTAAATMFGIYFTHSPWCLLAFVFPLGIRISHQREDEQNKEDEEQAEHLPKRYAPVVIGESKNDTV